MAVNVNEYKKSTQDGVTQYRILDGQVRILDQQNAVSYMYTAGLGYDGGTSHNIFTVHLVNGKSFVTDWSGVQSIGNDTRVNEYARGIADDGSETIFYTGHGLRIVRYQVVSMKRAGTGYDDSTLQNEVNLWRVELEGGYRLLTDQDGYNAINSAWC
jgi:hypothetical protein